MSNIYHSMPYKESTLQDFRRLIYYVVETAARHGECDSVLWESSLNPEITTESEETKANQALLSKSLTIPQEQASWAEKPGMQIALSRCQTRLLR